jgi:hypothetical protein
MVGSILFLVAMLFGTSGQILGVEGETGEDKVRDFFDDNISVMAETYSDKFGATWDPGAVGSVKRITDGAGGLEGYLVSFDKGYIGYSVENSVLCMDVSESPFLVNGEDHFEMMDGQIGSWENGVFYNVKGAKIGKEGIVGGNTGVFASDLYHPITDVINYNNFSVSSAIAQIPFLKARYNSSSWGTYSPICIYQDDKSDCGACASADLLYTYKLSGKVNLTKGEAVTAMRGELDVDEKWENNIFGDGIIPADMVSGFNNFVTNADYNLVGGYYDSTKPAIGCFSSLDIAHTGHYAVIVGKGQSDYWWIFKSYWDIVETWIQNYYAYNDFPISWDSSNYSCFYVVDNQYLICSYVLEKNGVIF